MFGSLLTALFQPEAVGILPLLRARIFSQDGMTSPAEEGKFLAAISRFLYSSAPTLARVDERDLHRKLRSLIGRESGVDFSPVRLLFQLADVFLTERNGLPAFKFWQRNEVIPQGRWEGLGDPIDKLELWRDISLRMDISPIIAAYLVAKGVAFDHPAYHPWRDLLINDQDVLSVVERGLAETHVHLSSLISFQGMIDVFLDPSSGFYIDVIKRLSRRGIVASGVPGGVTSLQALAGLLVLRWWLLDWCACGMDPENGGGGRNGRHGATGGNPRNKCEDGGAGEELKPEILNSLAWLTGESTPLHFLSKLDGACIREYFQVAMQRCAVSAGDFGAGGWSSHVWGGLRKKRNRKDPHPCKAGHCDMDPRLLREALLNERVFLGLVLTRIKEKCSGSKIAELQLALYLQLKNAVYRRMVMSRESVGFRAFRRKFRSMKTFIPEITRSLQTILTSYQLMVLEVRICPDDTHINEIKKRLVTILDTYRRLLAAGPIAGVCPIWNRCSLKKRSRDFEEIPNVPGLWHEFDELLDLRPKCRRPFDHKGARSNGKGCLPRHLEEDDEIPNVPGACGELRGPRRKCRRPFDHQRVTPNGNGGIPPHLGIVAHFTKPDEDAYELALKRRELGWNSPQQDEGEGITRWQVLADQCQSYLTSAMVISSLCERYPELTNYLVGIDVANVETSIPNYVFFPPISLLRDAWRYGGKVGRRKSLGLTFHAGEDFFDLVTILRGISWLLEAFRFLPGDRLGHGLALGVDPEWWYSHYSPVTITLEDEVLNEVWQHHLATEHVIDVGGLARCEERLIALARTWFDNPRVDMHSLRLFFRLRHEAFFLRLLGDGTTRDYFERNRYSPDSERERVLRRLGDRELARALEGRVGGGPYKILAEMVENYFNSPGNLMRGMELRHVVHDREFYRRVARMQEYVTGEVARRGVIVEANISSNFLIMGLDRISDHPVFRWQHRDGDTPALSVSLNTDNPAIFNTSLEMEYGLLFHGALAQGMNREEALNLLERVRQAGLRSAFIPSRKWEDRQEELLALCRLIWKMREEGAE